MFDDATLVFGAALERRLVDLREPLLSRHFQKAGPERRRKGDNRAGIVHVFVDELVVKPDAMALGRSLRHERRLGERIVDIIEDQGQFDDGRAVMHERWHHSIGVEFHIFGIVLIALKGEEMFDDIAPLFEKCDPDLLSADRVDVVIEFEHLASGLAIKLAGYTSTDGRVCGPLLFRLPITAMGIASLR